MGYNWQCPDCGELFPNPEEQPEGYAHEEQVELTRGRHINSKVCQRTQELKVTSKEPVGRPISFFSKMRELVVELKPPVEAWRPNGTLYVTERAIEARFMNHEFTTRDPVVVQLMRGSSSNVANIEADLSDRDDRFYEEGVGEVRARIPAA